MYLIQEYQIEDGAIQSNKYKSNGLNNKIYVITGMTGIPDDVSAIKAIAFDHIPKPFDNNGVLEVVNRAMQTNASKL